MNRKLMQVIIPSGVLASLLLFTFIGKSYENKAFMERMELAQNPGGRVEPAKDVIVPKNKPAPPESGKDADVAADSMASWISIFEGWGDKNPALDGSIIVIQPVLPVTGEGEKVIRTGSINLEVENGKDTYKQVSWIVQEFGGYLATSKFYKDDNGRESGTIILRIPKDKFAVALDRFGALGKIKDLNTDSKDVSREYANLKSQLDIAMVVYNKIFDALQRRQNTISDAMRMESELSPVFKRIEELKNKLEYLEKACFLATITLSFYETEVSIKTLRESTSNIRVSMINALISAIKMLAKAIPAVIVVGLVVMIMTPLVLIIKDWIVRMFKGE